MLETSGENFKTVVITGGPCSGKTTVIPHLRQTFEDRGLNVLTLPEAATHFFAGMGTRIGEGALGVMDFQQELIGFQNSSEQMIQRIAKQYKGKTLILLDRSVLDSGAYLEDHQLNQVLGNHKLTKEELLSGERYDGIIHLVTAADGAEEFYTTANNTARLETPEQARGLDRKTQQVYVGSPKLNVIDNSTGFEEKIRRVEKSVSQILGIPQPIEIENKYRVIVQDWQKLKSISRPVQIRQIYLGNDDGFEERIRQRAVNGLSPTFYHSIKIAGDGKERIELENIISPEEFSRLSLRGKSYVEKTRWCFLYKNQYFEFDAFEKSNRAWGENEGMLEIELVDADASVELPDFLELQEEVTENPDFKNHALSVAL